MSPPSSDGTGAAGVDGARCGSGPATAGADAGFGGGVARGAAGGAAAGPAGGTATASGAPTPRASPVVAGVASAGFEQRRPRRGAGRSLAGRHHPRDLDRARRHRPSRPAGQPAPRVGELPPADRDPPQGDVERPQEHREDEEPRPEIGRRGVGGQVVRPRLRRRLDRPAARRRAERGEVRLVRAEDPVLRGGRRDEPERPPQGRVPRPRLRDPDHVRPGVDLAEIRLVHARRRSATARPPSSSGPASSSRRRVE